MSGEEATSAQGFGGQIMVGEGGASSYLRQTSIHETYNRCLTVHGTDRLRISGNVCHDHLGHCYFFEDGAETDNSITGNLGLTTRRPAEGKRLLPSDGSLATSWITNPDNVVRKNEIRVELGSP